MDEMSNHLNRIYKSANRLLSKGNTTTKDIKEYLRTKFPNENWTQALVSDTMILINNHRLIDGLSFIDNGTFRTYYTQNNTVSTRRVRRKRCTKTQLLNLLNNHGGRFITITWTASDGKSRTYNGRIKSKPDGLGNMIFETTRDGIKTVIVRNIEKITSNNNIYNF